MRISKSSSSGIDELIPDSAEERDYGRDLAALGKKGERKPLIKGRNSQAWRRLEDRLNERRLRRKLKEVYEDD